MKKLYLFSFLAMLAFVILPTHVRAADESSFYATAVYAESGNVAFADNSIGAPDGIYTLFSKDNTAITLDLGEEYLDGVSMSLLAPNSDAAYSVNFLDSDLNSLQASEVYLTLGDTEISVYYTEITPFRYVKISNLKNHLWRLDAVSALTSATSETFDFFTDEELQELMDELIEMFSSFNFCGNNFGLALKQPNDGNLTTNADSIIYSVACDDTLLKFPNEQIFKSWWPNFENVSYINSSFLTSHETSGNVTVRPGTYLVKQTTSPEVYAVESYGLLRLIPDETTASTLFGLNWNQKVLDLSETLFSDYTIGDELTLDYYPAGTIGYLSTGQVVYLDSDSYYTVPGDVYNSLNFQNKFLVPLPDAVVANYLDGGDLNYNSLLAFPL